MNEEEEENAKTILKRMSTDFFKGAANKCPHCHRTGHFGSISTIPPKDKFSNTIMICGWCKSIIEI